MPLRTLPATTPTIMEQVCSDNAIASRKFLDHWLTLCAVIGIDLGTTYSCVGVMQKGKVEIIVNDQGNRITPSYVAFTDEERLVGDAAKNQYASNPTRTVFDIK